MSAFVVSKTHIDLLIAVAVNGPKGIDPFDWLGPYFRNRQVSRDYDTDYMSELGEMLTAENYRSVDYRYRENQNALREPYQFQEHYGRQLTVVEALKALSCYEYQSCECDDWEKSAACDFCGALRSSLIAALPGYRQAAWAIE